MIRDIYEVDKILEKKILNNEILYLVKWKGYSYEESTWEPKENLEVGAKQCIYYFEHKLKKKNANSTLSSLNRIDADISVSEVEDEDYINENSFIDKGKSSSVKLIKQSFLKKKRKNINDSTLNDLNKSTSFLNKDVRSCCSTCNHCYNMSIANNFMFSKDRLSSPKKILMAKKRNEKLYYLVEWKDGEKSSEILSNELSVKYPQLVIDYLESRIKFAK